MTGPHDSVIGVKTELATHRMRTGMPVRFEVADGGVRIEGVLVECDADERPGDARSGRCGLPGPDPAAAPARRGGRRRRRARGRAASTSHEAVRIELLHELPVVAREPDARERAGDEQQRDRGDRPARPGRARRSRAARPGTGVRRPCRTPRRRRPRRPRSARTALARRRRRGRSAPRRAAARQRRRSSSRPTRPRRRFRSGSASPSRTPSRAACRAAWWSASSTPDPRLSICSGRPSWRQTLRATPSGARIANGR